MAAMAMEGIETGYGALVCGMLHHMVMEPQLNLQEICLRLDEHVAASTSNIADEILMPFECERM